MEIEVKVRVEDLSGVASRAEALGLALDKPRHFEKNLLYDYPDRALSAAGCLLRVRETPEGGLLTFKGRGVADERFKIRPEVETLCDRPDNLHAILKNIGLKPFFRYEKYRTEYRREGVVLSLDELPFGLYLEIEGPPEAIEGLAADLGINRSRFLNRTYADLYGEWCRERGMPFGNILFPDE